MHKVFGNKLHITLFLLPALILFIGVLIAPIVLSGYYSLQDWNGTGAMDFVGLSNYKELFTSDSIGFMTALGNSLILAALSVCIQLPLALILALTLARGVKGERAFLSIYFMPVLISTVIIGQLWRKIYDPKHGLLNALLRSTGVLTGPNIIWLNKDPTLTLIAVLVPTLLQYVGYHMLLMYAGIKSVPTELREAAMLDGATSWQVNRHIIIPYIKPILRVSVIFAVTGSLKSFDLIYVLTAGKSNSVDVPSTLMYEMLFLRNRFGMGSAIAVILILLCFAFAILINAIFKKED